MTAGYAGVSGSLLKWAREQQKSTMRMVHELGGPSPSFQSEVERGRKNDVRADMLHRWVRVLGVTEAYAHGLIPRYYHDPSACQGLAAEVLDIIRSSEPFGQSWEALDPDRRTREVLSLVASRSTRLPRVVLAYVLGAELETLDRMLSGELVILLEQMKAIAVLTTLPETFFRHGTLSPSVNTDLERYERVLRMVLQLAISPDDLQDIVVRAVADRLKTRTGDGGAFNNAM